jgi:hypothetical protein
MANTINKAVNYLADPSNLNAVYKAASKTVDLEANQMQILGANVVKLPKYSFGGALGDYNRATGFTANDITKAWDTYTLSQDKGNSLLLDAMDDEESRGEGIVKATNEYIRQIVVPAVDTYRFTKLVAGTGTTKALTITAANAVDELETMFQTFEENEVPTEDIIIYMKPSVKTLLQTSSDLSRYVSYGTFEGKIDNRVMFYNGAKVISVPSARLGSDVEFIGVHPSAVVSCVKHNPAHFFAAGTHTGADADLVNYRLYYDLFVIANKTKGIYLQTVTE